MRTPRSFRACTHRKTLARRSRSVARFILTSAFAFCLPQAVKAATLIWDPAGDQSNSGGSDTWGTSSLFWNDDSVTPDVAWNNANNDIAQFQGTGGTVTLGAPITAGGLNFKAGGYTLTGAGNTLTLAGTTPTVQVNLGDTAVLDTIIAGSNGLTKTGGGALRLVNTGSTYTGITTISNGSLVIANQGALGVDTSAVMVTGSATRGFGGGQLVLEGGYATGLTLTRDIQLQGLGPITDRSSALASVGNNSITGVLSNGAALVNTGVSSAGGRLTMGDVTLGGTAGTTFMTFGVVNDAGVGSYAITGILSGTGSISKTGGGTLFLTPSSASGYAGTVQVSAGSIRIANGDVLGTSAAANAIDLNGGIFEVRMDTPNLNTHRVNVNNGGTLDLVMDHAIGGSTVLNQTVTFANLDYDIDETLTINTRNGYGITFTAATAQGNQNGDITFTNNGNGVVTYGGTLWGDTGSTANILTIGGSGNSVLTGEVTATGALHTFVKSGTGTVTLRGTAGTFTGATTTSGGALIVTDFRSLNNNTAAINIGSGTTAGILTIGSPTTPSAAGLTTSKVINLNGSTGGATINASQTGTNPVILNAAFTASGGTSSQAKTLTLGGTNTADNIINGAIPNNAAGGTVNLTKTDAGVWVLAGTNSYTGATTITGGTLKLKANAAASTIIADTSALTFDANATTGFAGGTLQLTGVSGSATTENLGALTPTAGAGTVTLTTGGAGAASNLTFGSLGATTAASSVNFNTTNAGGGIVTLTGQVATTATTLPGTANFQGHLYINGADFATINGSAQVVAPSYATGSGNFQNASTALIASVHNLLTGSFTNGAATVSSLKMTNQTLTLSGNLTVSLGAILQTGGTGSILSNSTSARTITGSAGGVNIGIRVDGASDVLNIGSAAAPVNIASATTAGLTKNGAGKLVFWGTNAQGGTTTINEGSVQIAGTAGRLSATNASVVIRQGASLELNGVTTANATINSLDGGGKVTNVNAAAATLTIGSAGTWAGTFEDGTGVLNVTKAGTTGAPTWSGLSTYTGVTTIAGTTGLVSVPNLANIGTASGIGKGNNSGGDQATIDANNAASLVFGATTGGISYTGTTSVSIDRLFTFGGGTGGQIANASGNNSTLIFNKTNPIVFAAGTTASQTLTLGGASTGDNRINLQIINNTNAGNAQTNVSKVGAGLWILGNTSNNYTGTTTITAGALNDLGGTTLPANSPIIFGGGVLESSGTFVRPVATAAPTGNANNAFWSTGGGFAASEAKLVVALGGIGSPTALTWAGTGGTAGFVPSGSNLIFNSTTALSEVEFRNDIDLNGGTRTIQVDDNSTTFGDFATMTGVLSNSVGTGSISKSGTGVLQLFGANTYNGTTAVTAGQLVVTSLGNSADAAAGTSVGINTGANSTSQAITLGNGTTTGASLVYVGVGETSDRMIRLNTTTATNTIYAQGSGALVLTNVLNDMTTGAKTLTLRGSNTAGNMITSALANNTGNLAVTVDGGATWILTNPGNSYSGATSVSAGALGIGADTALGTSTLQLSSGSVFAYGGDRTISNPVQQSNNTTVAFVGDNSLTFTSTFVNQASANSPGMTNAIGNGKFLSLQDITFNSITAGRTWTISGTGDTRFNGNLTTSTAFNVGLTYTGTGSLTLGGSGNNFNAGNVTVSAGTLKIGNNEVIPDGAGKGNLIINPAIGVTATLDLAGHTETVNAFTANSAGNIVIDNTAAGNASLIFGANDNTVAFGGGGGTYTITDSGAGALSITKVGTTNLTIAAGNTLSYQGATTVTGGIFTIASALTGTTALSATGTGSNLNLTGGLTNSAAITSVTVGAGSFLSLLDGSGTPMLNLSTLNLGAGTGMATLSLEVGALTDTLTVSNPAAVTNTIQLNLSGISGLDNVTDYILLSAPSGLSAASYVLGSQPGGFSSGFLTVSDTVVKYTSGSAIVGNLYWNNTQADGSWAHNVSGATNFTTDLAGATDGTFTPGPGTTVIFGTTALTGGPAITTTLDANFTVAGLQFTSNPTGVTSWTINAGTPATSNLTVKGSGIDVGNNAGAVTINPAVILGAAQTWNVDGGGANGSSLTVANVISGNGFALTKTGAGTLNLSGVNTFNGGLTIKGGTVVGSTSATVFGAGPITLGDTSGSNSATLQVNTTGLTFTNPIVLATGGTGTLTIGTPVNAAAVSETFSGGVTGANSLVINNQSLSGTATFSVNPINISGTITNVGTSTGTVTISGGVGSNVTGVTLNSTTSALTISTNPLTVNSGGTTFTNVAGTKVLTVSGGVNGTGNLTLNNNSAQAAGVTVSGSVNPVGTITNSGTGTGDSTISGIIGTNVTGVVQNSPTSILILSGANTVTSGYNVKAGTLRLATSGASVGGSGNNITLGDTSGTNAATLAFQSTATYDAIPITVSSGTTGTLTISGSTTTGAAVVTSPISLGNNLTVGNMTTGVTTGTLTIQGGITGTGNLTISNVSTGTGAMTFSVNPIDISGTITNSGAGTGAAVISGGIGSNVTGVTQNSATSALTISGANNSAGGVTLTQGTLNINHATALGNGGPFTITAGTINNSSGAAIVNSNANPITINGDFAFTGSNALDLGTGAVSLGNAAGTARTITANASTLTLGGSISNGATAVGLTKAGAGTLSLTGASTFTGPVTVSAGTLQFTTVSNNGGAASSLGQGTDGISLGATLSFVGSTNQSTNRAMTLTAGSTLLASGVGGATITYQGAITAATFGLTLDGAGTGILAGVLTHAGSTTADITKNGTGTWTLSANNVIADDILVNAGTLNVNSAQTVTDDFVVTGATTVVNINAAAAFTGDDLFIRGSTVKLGINGALTSGMDDLNVSVDTASGSILDIAGTTGSAPTDIFVGNVGFTGSVIDSVGGGSIGGNFGLRNGVFSANMTGAGTVTKTTAETATVSGTNTGYTGVATVSEGTLIYDYTTTNTEKVSNTGAGALTMAGGTVVFNGSNSAATIENVGGLTLSAGSSLIDVNNGTGQSATLNFGNITRAALSNDGTVRFELPLSGAITTTRQNTNGILGGWATVRDTAGVVNFAANDGANNIVAVSSTAQDNVALWAFGQHVTDSAGFSGSRSSTSIGSIRFNANAASSITVPAGNTLNLSSGGILMTSNAATGAHSISGGTLTSGIGELIFIQDSTAQSLSVSSAIVGGAGVTKAGNGTLTLSGTNNYTGPTDIQAGTLVASGGNAIGDASFVSLALDRASTLQLTGNETIGGLAGGNVTSVLGTVDVGSNTLTINQSVNSTYAGVFTGSGAIVRNGTSGLGNLQLTGVSGAGFTGTVTINGGLLYLETAATLNASSITVNKGGSFLISNNGTTRSGTRILDTTPIILNSANGSWNGETKISGLAIRTDQAATTNETIGNLVFNSGANYLRGDASGSTGVASIIADNFVRNNNATVAARGRAMGATSGDRNQFRIGTAGNQTAFIGTVDNANLVGGDGAAGTKTIDIVPWAIGETTTTTLADTNMGNSLVTYVSAAGFRALDFTTEYNTFATRAGATDNIRESLTTDLTGLAGTTINALVLHNANTGATSAVNVTGTGAGQSLAVGSGALLFTANPAAAASSTHSLVLGGFDGGISMGGAGITDEYVIHVVNPSAVASGPQLSVTIASNLVSTADITKAGRGTLILSGLNTAGGGTKKTTINEGTLEIADLDNIGGSTGGLVFAGGTLRLGTGFADDVSTRSTTFLLGGATLDTGASDFTLANSIGGGGAGGFTKTGSGTLTLQSSSTYTGGTAVGNGKLILNGGASNRISSTGGLVLGSDTNSGVVQLGNAGGASDQTVTELSSSGTGTANALVGGDAAVSTLTVNQTSATTYAGSLGGAGANENNLGLVKSGVGTLTLSGATLSYTGATTVNAGILNITGSPSAALTTSAITVAAGGTLNFFNNAGQAINLGAGTLNLGAGSGATVLGLELGSTSAYDSINTTGAATAANLVVLNLAGVSGFGAGTYDLLTAASGLSGSTYLLGSLSGSLTGVTFGLTTSDTLVRLSTAASTGNFYWQGSLGSSWFSNVGLDTNFTTDLAGTTNAHGTPGAASTLIFSAQNASSPAISTTLDTNFTVNDLKFAASPSGVASVTIAAGTPSTSSLTIAPAVSTDGIDVAANAGTASIAAPVVLGANQSWNVDGTGVSSLSVSGGVSGTANLAKTGSGVLTLSGTNAYTGSTTVSGGILQAGATNGLGASSAHIINSGGTLRLNNFAATIGSLAGAGTVENGTAATAARALTVGGDNTSTTFSGTLQDGGPFGLALTKVGNGTLTLSGTNTSTGNITVSAGALNVTGSVAGNAASTLLVYGGATVGNAVANVSGNMTLFGVTGSNVSGGVAIYNQTAGTVNVTGNTTTAVYNAAAAGSYGYFNLTGGTFKDSNRFALAVTQNVATPATSVVYIGGNGFLDLRSSEWMLNYSHGHLTVADNAVVDRTGATQNYGIIMNSTVAGGVYGVLNVAGGSFLTTTRAIQFGNSTTANNGNNNTAMINLAGGTLQVGAAMTSSLPTAGANNAYLNFAGGTLKTSAGITNWIPASTGAITYTANLYGPIDNSALAGAPSFTGGLTFDTNGFDSSLNAVLGGATGDGVAQSSLSVTGGSGYVGAPEVVFTGGTLAAGGSPAAGYALISGGQVTGIVITSPGSYTSAPTVTLTGGGGTGASVSVGTLVANTSAGLTKVGSGTLTLSASNTYTGGTTVNAGTLTYGAANVLADTGAVTVNGGTLNVATFNDTVGPVTLQSGSITGTSGVLSGSAYDVRSGTISAILGGSGNLTKTTAGTVNLTGVNTFSGSVNVNGGVLAFPAAANLGNGSATNTISVDGGTLNFTGTGAAALTASQTVTLGVGGGTVDVSSVVGALTVPGNVSGSAGGDLTKAGAGTLILSGTNNLGTGGGVIVNGGTLRAGFGTNGASAITVASGSVLEFINNAAEALTLEGTAGALSLSSGSTLGFELGASGTNDSITIASGGSALTGGTITLNFTNLGGLAAGTYDLINILGGGTGLNAANYVLGSAPSGFNYMITKTDSLVQLTTSVLIARYWTGDQDASWATNNAGNTNWSTTADGLTEAGAAPDSTQTVIFSASNAPFTSGSSITTTLDGNRTIDSLQFQSVPTGVTSVAINQGTGGSLTIQPVSANNGIVVAANAGNVSIAAPLIVGSAQTWTVDGTGVNGSSLTVSGDVAFNSNVNKMGAGALTLSGNNTGAGGVTLSAGRININSATALGTGPFVIGSGTTIDNTSAGAVTVTANNAQTWSGNFTFAGTQALNLGTGAVTLGSSLAVTTNGSNLTVGGGIDDGPSSFAITKGGTGALTLSGANTYGGGTILSAGTLNINSATALGTGALTINGGTIDNTSGGALTVSANNPQNWNAGFTFTGSNNLNLGSGAVTLGASVAVVVAANMLTAGSVSDGVNSFGLTKDGAGTLVLAGAAYDGATVISNGTLKFASGTQALTGTGNTLTFGGTAGTTITGALDLSTASATFGGATVVQTNTSTANTVTIGGGQTLRLNGAVTVGYNSAATSTTKLTVSGGGILTIGAVGAPTNANVQVGAGATSGVSNGGTLDLSGLSTFYANLGTGTFRIGDPTNSGGTGTAGSTLILAADSTINATTFTTDSPSNSVTQVVKLGSGTNVINANTIEIGAAANRANATLDFNTGTGTLQVRNLAGTGRANMTVAYGSSTTGSAFTGTVNLAGHSADLLLNNLNIGGRTGTSGSNATGTVTFDTGTLDATSVIVGDRRNTATNSGTSTATLNLNGGAVTIGTGGITIATSTATFGTSSVTGTVNIGGSAVVTVGATGGTSITLGKSSSLAATAILNITGTSQLTVAGNIIEGTGAGNASVVSTLTLNGGTLNLAGFNLGTATEPINNLNFQSGTLRNVGTINGTGGVTKTTAGTLLMDTANSYTGTTTVSAGILSITHNNALGTTASGTAVSPSGTLQLSNNITISGESLSLTATAAGDAILNSAAGSNTWTGPITVDTGSDATARVRVLSAAGSSLLISGPVTLSAGTQDFTIGGDGDGEISGQLTGAQRLFKSSVGAGTWILSNAGNASTFSGRIAVGNGTLQVASEANLGTTPVSFVSNQLTLGGANFGTLRTTANMSLSANRGVSLGAGGGGFNEDAGTTLTVDSVIAGAGSLTKSGAGTLVLTAANSYGGATTLGNGILRLGASEVIPDASPLAITSGTFDLNGNAETIGGLSGGGIITNSAGGASTLNIAYNGGTDSVFSGQINNAGGVINVVKSGTGTLVFSGANTYAGTTTVDGGTLRLGAPGAVPAGTTLIVNAGVFDLNGNDQTVAGLSGNGVITNSHLTGNATFTVNYNGGTATTFGGQITNGGGSGVLSFVKSGTGTLVLSGTNTYKGSTTINGGTLSIGASAGLGDSTAVTNTVTIDNAVLEVTGNVDLGANRVVTINAGGAIFKVTSGNTLTVPAAIGGAGALDKTDSGTLALGNSGNSYNGATTISAGTLQLGASDVLPDGAGKGGVTLGGTLDLNGHSETINSLTGSGTVDNTAASTSANLSVGSDGSSSTFNGTLANSGGGGSLALTKVGAGSLTLGGNSTFTGGVTIQSGTVFVSANGNLGGDAGALTFGGASTLAITDSFVASRAVILNAAATVDVADTKTGTLSGKISGTGGLTKTGLGTLALTNSNTAAPDRSSYSGGTTINAGTLAVSLDQQLGDDAASVSFGGNATLQTSGAFSSARGVAIGAGLTGTVEVTGTTATLSGTVSGATGTLRKAGAGELVLSNTGSNTYGGGTTIAAGTLTASKASDLGTGDITFSGASTFKAVNDFTFSRSVNLNAASTFEVGTGKTLTLDSGSSLHGSGQLIKSGAGTLVVGSTNQAQYTGGVTVDAGTFVAANASGSATGDGDVTVNSAGTLAGNGFISGHVSGNGSIAPGMSIGVLSTGALSLFDGATLKLELQTGTLTADRIDITGDLSLSGVVTLSLSEVGTDTVLNEGDRITLANYSGVWNGGHLTVPGFGEISDWSTGGNVSAFAYHGNTFAIDYNYDGDVNSPSNPLSVSLVVVPEPGAFASLAGSAAMLLGLQRFRRRKNA